MTNRRKAIFLPIDDRILDLYKGFVLKGKTMPNLKESDRWKPYKTYKYIGKVSVAEKIFTIFMIPFIPVFILISLIGFVFHIEYFIVNEGRNFITEFYNIFFKKEKVVETDRKLKNKYFYADNEDIPKFLTHCNNHLIDIHLYSYRVLTAQEQVKVDNLIRLGLISSCQIISKLSDMIFFIKSQNISIFNSKLIIKDYKEKYEADLLGFYSGNGDDRNVSLWCKDRRRDGKTELEWNSRQVLIYFHHQTLYYLRSKNKAFLSSNLILFIDDTKDEILNLYMKNNIDKINEKLAQKKMQLIYFPSFTYNNIEIQEPIFKFIRYRFPVLYSLTDFELGEAIQILLRKISYEEFYRMVLEELELPLFKKPCLLWNLPENFVQKNYYFDSKYIEYQSEKDLDDLFGSYIQQANPGQDILYSIENNIKANKIQGEYNADLVFGLESKQYSEELMHKINSIKSHGEYAVLAEAIMYMLETIKDEKPEILKKIKPLIENRKLLETKIVLSPVMIDKHYNIFLPDFGNIEVKMHALPKTVYILFLQYPHGIRFKELYQHKSELLAIYNKVTNKYEPDEIIKAIDDLVDMTNPSINQKCARIRESFRNIMDEHIAKYYYIDGQNGEPKKIALPIELIDIRF
jgi:hypothetical protein